jgi:methionyl aminopeptidase
VLQGKLAAEVLDFIEPHVKPGITTGELDRLCHEYMVNVQGTIPAPLNYAPPGYQPYPKSVCTSVNHVVCHGVPGDKKLKAGDIINIDITVIKDGFHGDTSRMFCVGQPQCRRGACVKSLTSACGAALLKFVQAQNWATLDIPFKAAPKSAASA